MDPFMSPEVIAWAESLGFSATVGLVLLGYILKVLIPAQQKMFQEALKAEQEAHGKLIQAMTDSNEKAFSQFAQVLIEQNRQIERLAEAVNKLHGMFLAEDQSRVSNG
tara:strand:+ start:331 stop:654 length:324 start_codon:yes stop_codon:yes gene_type:complete